MTAKPPDFTLAQLEKLLAEKCAEDVAALARWASHELEAILSRCDPRLSEVADDLMRDVVRPMAGSTVSLSAEIAAKLRSRILDGDLRPGDMLPGAKTLAAEFHVEARTVRRATDQLRAEGLLIRTAAAREDGSTRLYVAAPDGECGLSPVCSIPGCGKPRANRGWCHGHYHRWQRYGDPLGQPEPEPVIEFICLRCGIIATRVMVCCDEVVHVLGFAQPAMEPQAV